MRILTLDCATSTGWSIGENTDAGVRLVEFGTQVFDLRRGESPGMRFRRFRAWLPQVWFGSAVPELTRERAEQLAWAAGFFDGEGCFGSYEAYKKEHVAKDGSVANYRVDHLTCQISQSGSPELLNRFASIVGRGDVRGPYEDKRWETAQPRFQYRCTGLSDVQATIEQLWPWLGRVKREQAERALGIKVAGMSRDPKHYRPPGDGGLVRYEMAHYRGGAATELLVGFVTRVQEFAALYGIECEGVHSTTLKKAVTGRGNADKEAVRTAMLVRWNDDLTRLRRTIANHDEADALALLAFEG